MTTATQHVTTDHQVIRKWAEVRGGEPATVTGTEGAISEPGILRIHFPGFGEDQKLQRISWDDFFAKFEEKELAFYRDDSENARAGATLDRARARHAARPM